MKPWYELISYDREIPVTEPDTEQDLVLEHVVNCTADGFCYTCQSL